MNPKIRTALAIVTGIGAGGLVIALMQGLNSALFPLPEGLDMADPEAVGRALADAGPSVLFGVALSYFWGPFAGGWLATSLANDEGRLVPGVVTGFFMLGTILTLASFPHPLWFWFAGPAAIAAGGHFGWMKGVGTVRARNIRAVER